MITHLEAAGGSRTLADCIQIIQKNGTVRGFTSLDKNIAIDISDGNGEIIYQAETGFTGSNISESSGYSVDNFTLEGFIKAGMIELEDIHAGDYDFAELRTFQVNFENLSDGILKGVRGHLGEISIEDLSLSLESRSLKDLLNQSIVDVATVDCLDDFGGPRCRVRRNPSVWVATTAYTERLANDANTGSVVSPTTFNDRQFKCTTAGTSGGTEPVWNLTIGGTTTDGTVVWTTIQSLYVEAVINSVTSASEFTITASTDAPDALLTLGTLTFLTGVNATRNIEVDSWVLSTKAVILFRPMPVAPAPGDVITILAGCNKLHNTCTTFDNIFNFFGVPYLPGTKVFIPGQLGNPA